MKIAIGCDHGGFGLKGALVSYLEGQGYEYIDYGCYDKNSVDYNDHAIAVGEAVASGKCDKGILICGTGIGMSIVANKIKGVRCAHCHDIYSAKMTRLHNDTNVLAFGERVIGAGLMADIVDTFLKTEFSNEERHIRRVQKIKDLEEKYFK